MNTPTSSFESDVEFYLDSNTQASTRVRFVLTLLVTATILTAMGLLNSYKNSWMTKRLETNFSYSNWQSYIREKYKDDTNFEITDTSKAWQEFRQSYYKAYIDNALNIKIPFFGVAFDINDLGLFSGIGLSAIFILLYMSLGNEISCLGLAFRSLRFYIDTYFFDFLNSAEAKKEVQKVVVKLHANNELKYVQNFKSKLNRITSRKNSVYERLLKYLTRNGRGKQSINIKHIRSLAQYVNKKNDFNIEDPKDFIRIVAFIRRKKWITFKQDLNIYDELRQAAFFNFKEIIPKEGNRKMDDFHNFYHLLATRQVFVLPFIEGSKHPYKRILGLAQRIPLFICFFPVMVFCFIVINDIITFKIGTRVDAEAMMRVAFWNFFFLCVVSTLAYACWGMWKKIKHLWESTWEELKFYKSYVFLINIDDFLKHNPYPKFIKK